MGVAMTIVSPGVCYDRRGTYRHHGHRVNVAERR